MKLPRTTKDGGDVNIGILGCGNVAQLVHLPVLAKMDGVKVVAISDRDSQRLEEAAKIVPGATMYGDYAELLAVPDVEAVVVCLPTALHTVAAIAAMREGKQVYLEKPVATNARDARRLLKVWRQAGVVGMVGFNYRFNHFYHDLISFVESNQIGSVVAVRSVFSTAAGKIASWKKSGEGSGALLDLASHEIDLIRFVLGDEVAEVFADSRSMYSEADTVALQLKMNSGVAVQIIVALAAVEEAQFEVTGDRGKVMVDRYRSLKVAVTGPYVEGVGKRFKRALAVTLGARYLVRRIRAPWGQPSFETALKHFVGAVRDGRPASPDFFDGWQSLAVILAAEESARSHQVAIPCYAAAAEPVVADLGDLE